jgi:hypothetical protein
MTGYNIDAQKSIQIMMTDDISTSRFPNMNLSVIKSYPPRETIRYENTLRLNRHSEGIILLVSSSTISFTIMLSRRNVFPSSFLLFSFSCLKYRKPKLDRIVLECVRFFLFLGSCEGCSPPSRSLPLCINQSDGK